MLEKEARGMQSLTKSAFLKIPAVISCGVKSEDQFLILEWLESVRATAGAWETFGRGLAELHRQTNHSFGWEEDNYIGSLEQRNTMCSIWAEFYSQNRILPLVKSLYKTGAFILKDVQHAEGLCNELTGIFPSEPPALVHGDLWSGNYLMSTSGPAIFDPAVYYGHREMDIGMSMLFGGFDGRFYESYDEAYPLERDWKKRVAITQLYPLLVHAVLFGGGYIERCREILRR